MDNLGFTDVISFEGDTQDINQGTETEETEIMDFGASSEEEVEEIPEETEEVEEAEDEQAPEQVEEKKPEEQEEQESEEVQEFEIDEAQLRDTLLESNILTNEDIEGAETIEEAFVNKGSRLAREELEDFFNSQGQEAFEAVKAVIINGVDPKEYFLKSAEVKRYSNMDTKNKADQEKMVMEYYTKHVGMSEEEARENIEQKRDYDLLESEANIAKTFLVKAESEQLKKEVAQKEYESRLKEQEAVERAKAYDGLLEKALKENSLGGIPISIQDREKVNEFINKKTFRNKSTGEELTGFEHFLLRLKYSNEPEVMETALKIAVLEQNGWDMSRYDKKVISQDNKRTFSNVIRKKAASNRRSQIKDSFIVKK